MEPDPWQARLLRSRAPWILLNCCRQSGKSTTTAAVALHTAIYDPGLILLVSPSLRQSKELFAKVIGFLKDLEPAEVLEEDNKRVLSALAPAGGYQSSWGTLLLVSGGMKRDAVPGMSINGRQASV